MKNKPTKLVIIDGHAIIHRAYHALPPMTRKDGTMVNAVYGFASMILKVMDTMKPSHMVVTFDVSKDTFRSELYKEYKAHREKADDELYAQIPLIKDFLAQANIDMYEKEGYEADDVIGTIAEEMKDEVDTVIIVTGDKDMLQLVDNQSIEVYLLKKGLSEFILYNEDKVVADFGFTPIQMIDYKALKGDSSDNIPGIKGIGEKTAKQLLGAFKTISNMYEQAQGDSTVLETAVTARMADKAIEGRESAEMSYELAKIKTDVSGVDFTIDEASLDTVDTDGLKQALTTYEFFSLLKRVTPQEDTGAETVVHAKDAKEYNVDVHIVGTDIGIDEVKQQIEKTETIFCHIVYSSTDMLTARIEGATIGIEEFVYFLTETQLQELFLTFEKKILVGHNLKQLMTYCLVYDMIPNVTLFDVMIASYLVNSSTRSHDLRSVIMRELDISLPKESKQGNLFGINPLDIGLYVSYIKELYNRYTDALESHNVRDVFDTIEMPLIPVLAEMEQNGIAVDEAALSDLSERVAQEIKHVSETIWALAGEEFNISSTVQLRDILFDTLELPTQGIKKGKTGYSTAASELEKLREYHEIIPLIEEYRELEKLRNTYIDVLPTLLHTNTNRIHTSFNQAVTTTGRLSSSNPNLQNIPIRTKLGKEIRNTFIADKGYTLVAADYSQIELRIVAHLAQDETLLNTFKEGKDIHTATAAIIHGISEKDVTPEIRRTAKEVNFGVLYGMGAWGLANRTGISRSEAKEFIDTYFERFAAVKQYLDDTITFAEKHGYVETLYGRRRYIPELTSTNYQLRSAGERMAINMPVQGTAADIMKLAMVHVRHRIKEIGRRKDIKLLLQVHDELVIEVTEDQAEDMATLLEEEMIQVCKLDVPIVVETHIGSRWGTLK